MRSRALHTLTYLLLLRPPIHSCGKKRGQTIGPGFKISSQGHLSVLSQRRKRQSGAGAGMEGTGRKERRGKKDEEDGGGER